MNFGISLLLFIFGGSIFDFLNDPWPPLGSMLMLIGTLGMLFFGGQYLLEHWHFVHTCYLTS